VVPELFQQRTVRHVFQVAFFFSGWLRRLQVPFLSQPRTVDFDAFQRFVKSKDTAIEEAFRVLDLDGNGKITRQELEDGIRHVRVICGGDEEPQQPNVFRPKVVCAKKMIRLMAKDGKETISYQVKSPHRVFAVRVPKVAMESACSVGMQLGETIVRRPFVCDSSSVARST
jgi:hypothetical protein